MPSNNLSIRLTDQQQNFVEQILAGRRPDDAARAAGYAESIAATVGRLLHHPAIAAAIKTAINMRLVTEALPLAYSVLCEIARDATVLPAVRRAAARDLIDRAGIVPPKAPDATPQGDKPLSEMTSEELRALVDRLESELCARAVDVSDAPKTAAPIVKPLAYME